MFMGYLYVSDYSIHCNILLPDKKKFVETIMTQWIEMVWKVKFNQ